MLLDVAYVGNRADGQLLFANYNQAAPEQRRGNDRAGRSASDSGFRRHHLCVQRRQVPLQGAAGEGRVAPAPGRHPPELADPVADRRTTARSRWRTRTGTSRRRRTSTTWTPTSACRTTTSRTTARRASSGRCRSAADSAGPPACRRSWTRSSAGGSWPGSTVCSQGSRSPSPTRRARRSWSRGSCRTSAARTTTGRTSRCDPYAQGSAQTITNWFDRDCVSVPTDPSQPFGNAKRNTVRGPKFTQFDLAASKRVAGRRPRAPRAAARGVQPVQPHELPRAQRRPQRGRVRHHHEHLRSAPAAARSQAAVVRQTPARGYQWQRVIEIWAEHPPRSDDPPERVWP